MTRFITMAILATAILLSFACATGEATDPRDLILERMREVSSTNYKTHLTADVIPPQLLQQQSVEAYRADLRSEWDGEKFNLGQDIDKVEQVMRVSAGNATYFLVSGDFDFGEIEEFLEQNSYKPQEYWHERGIYTWHTDSANPTLLTAILFPDSGFYYFDEANPYLESFWKSLDQGEGFKDSSDDLRKLLDRTDSSAFISEVMSDCSMVEDLSLNGCMGLSWSAIGGDETTARLSYAVLFDSPENAEAGAPEIEADIKNEAKEYGQNVELTDLEVNENIVTFNLALLE